MAQLSIPTADEARTEVDAMLVQLTEARNAVAASERRVAYVRKSIEALIELHPELEDLLPEELDSEGPRPRGAEAVFEVLESDWETVPSVVNLLERRGWAPVSSNPANAVRTALERLVAAKRIEKGRTDRKEVVYRKKKDGYDYDEEPF
jgi:hypothetical protein